MTTQEATRGESPAPALGRRREWSLRLLLLVLSLLSVLVFAEVGLRVVGFGAPQVTDDGEAPDGGFTFFRHDPHLGWDLVPGAADRHTTGEFDVDLWITSQGLRAPREFSPSPLPGMHRVVVLGDSFSFGHGVDVENAWPARVEAALPSTEVVNLAVTGYGVDQMLLRLEHMSPPDGSLAFAPDLVILGLFVGDVFRVADDAYMGYAKPRFHLRDGTLDLVVGSADHPVPQNPPAPQSLRLHTLFERTAVPVARHLGGGDAWPLTQALVARLKTRCTAADARLVAVVIPKDQSIYGSGPRHRLHDRTLQLIDRLLADVGVPALDLTPALRKAAAADPSTPLYYSADGHWTAAGHRVAAEAVAGWLAAFLATTAGDDAEPAP